MQDGHLIGLGPVQILRREGAWLVERLLLGRVLRNHTLLVLEQLRQRRRGHNVVLNATELRLLGIYLALERILLLHLLL